MSKTFVEMTPAERLALIAKNADVSSADDIAAYMVYSLADLDKYPLLQPYRSVFMEYLGACEFVWNDQTGDVLRSILAMDDADLPENFRGWIEWGLSAWEEWQRQRAEKTHELV